MARRAGPGGNAPAGQGAADTLGITVHIAAHIPDLGMQQQGGNAGGFRRQLQTPALPQIQAPHLAHHHGQAGTFQAFLHGPQALLIIPPPDQDQARRIQAKRRQSRAIQRRPKPPVGGAPQHSAAAAMRVKSAKRVGRRKRCPPGRQHGGKSQRRAAAMTSMAPRAQNFMQTATGQAAAGQPCLDRRHAKGQGRLRLPGAHRTIFNGRDAPAQRRHRGPPGTIHSRPFPCT